MESEPQIAKDLPATTDRNGTHSKSEDIPSPADSTNITDRRQLLSAKPPNILVYADSTVAKENVKEVLATILNKDK